ncbi:MAG: hypothetical protein E7054_07605 [Lentisphaerae bacterium]|nr:hypothetical protein [Lentisphaerota bacterium]
MSKLFLLLFAIFCGGMLSANTPELVINPDAENWQKVLTEQLKRYPQTDTLRLELATPSIPELPEHDFKYITINLRESTRPVSLIPLSKFKLKSLSLIYGSFKDLYAIDRSSLESLNDNWLYDSAISTEEYSGLDFSELRRFTTGKLNGSTLDLSKVPKLEKLRISSYSNAVHLILHPDVKLKELSIPGDLTAILPGLDLSCLENLTILYPQNPPVDYSILETLQLPKLKGLDLFPTGKGKLRLPLLPYLQELNTASGMEVSLKMLKDKCPDLKELSLSGKVTDWDILPSMPLEKLHIRYVDNVKYVLPVSAPANCVVTGLPDFTENPYKMWTLWGVCVTIFALCTMLYRHSLRKELK